MWLAMDRSLKKSRVGDCPLTAVSSAFNYKLMDRKTNQVDGFLIVYYKCFSSIFLRLFTKKPHAKRKKKKFMCGSPNWLPILEALGQVAGLIVVKISVMLK